MLKWKIFIVVFTLITATVVAGITISQAENNAYQEDVVLEEVKRTHENIEESKMKEPLLQLFMSSRSEAKRFVHYHLQDLNIPTIIADQHFTPPDQF